LTCASTPRFVIRSFLNDSFVLRAERGCLTSAEQRPLADMCCCRPLAAGREGAPLATRLRNSDDFLYACFAEVDLRPRSSAKRSSQR
jgi:hypothetical protein